jgi:hypothetical protein
MADTQVEAPKFDPIAYQQKANEQEQARRNGAPLIPPVKEPEKPKEAAKEAEKPAGEPDEDRDKRISRSDRRRLKAFEEAAEWKGKAEALQAVLDRLGPTPVAAPPSGSDDPEPQRSAYSSDAEYNRALGRWDARQETQKIVKESTQTAEQRAALQARVRESNEKFNQDIEKFPDWKEVQAGIKAKMEQQIEDGEEPLGIASGSHLDFLLNTSRQAAGIVYHWAKNPEVLEELLKMGDNDQTDAFRQLEGEVKVLYSFKQAAQAEEKPPKDRTHPAEAQAGRNSASERDAGKPRPSTEVAARGGSAPPEEPRIGSPAWHQRENERERAMRGR